MQTLDDFGHLLRRGIAHHQGCQRKLAQDHLQEWQLHLDGMFLCVRAASDSTTWGRSRIAATAARSAWARHSGSWNTVARGNARPRAATR